jgi:predicted MFS family arabinose efflux permease
MGRPLGRVTFRSVLAVPEFRAMWVAELFSVAGDQLARVALAILVFQRTESATLTGLTYALTFVPSIVGGVFLAGLADRYPRRDVMVAADLVRVVLVGLMAVPGTPLWLLWVLLTAATLANGPFKAAQVALLPDVLAGERFTVGLAIRNITSQAAQLAGFAGGGALIALLNPSVGLAVNAATFLISAVVVRAGVGKHALPARNPDPTRQSSAAVGTALVWRDPGLRTLLGLCWLAGFYIAPEALAAPYAAAIGGGTVAVGLIMAADPVGSVLGAFVFSRWIPEHAQVKAIGMLGIMSGIPLVVCVVEPGLLAFMALIAVSGACATAYNIRATALFVRGLPEARRAQGSGLLSSGLSTVQGLGVLMAGVLADGIGPAHTIALAGIAGVLVAIPIAIGWRRVLTCRGYS